MMRADPKVVDLARQAQRLAGFDGLPMTPLQCLHITTLLAGPAAVNRVLLQHRRVAAVEGRFDPDVEVTRICR